MGIQMPYVSYVDSMQHNAYNVQSLRGESNCSRFSGGGMINVCLYMPKM